MKKYMTDVTEAIAELIDVKIEISAKYEELYGYSFLTEDQKKIDKATEKLRLVLSHRVRSVL